MIYWCSFFYLASFCGDIRGLLTFRHAEQTLKDLLKADTSNATIGLRSSSMPQLSGRYLQHQHNHLLGTSIILNLLRSLSRPKVNRPLWMPQCRPSHFRLVCIRASPVNPSHRMEWLSILQVVSLSKTVRFTRFLSRLRRRWNVKV